MSVVDDIEQRAERGTRQGPDTVWHAALATVGEQPPGSNGAGASERSVFRIVVAACAMAFAVVGMVGLSGREVRDASPATQSSEDGTTTRLLLDQGQALVVIDGFEMVEAFMTAGPVEVAGIDEWQAFVKPGGAVEGFAMVGTTAQGGFELRLSSIARGDVSEFLELDENDRWSLSESAGLDGPFAFQLGLRTEIEEPITPTSYFAFVDREDVDGAEVSLTVIPGPAWPLLHSVVSGEEWPSEDPPSWEPTMVLGVNGLGTQTTWGSFAVWSDDDWSYLLRSTGADTGPAPISTDALADLAVIAPQQEWATAVEAAAPDYGQPWTDLAARTGTIAAAIAFVVLAINLMRRRRQPTFSLKK